jgi:transposase
MLCIIVDNARWHLTKAVLDFIKMQKIKMIRLLPYSPELNPIEQFWKNIKQYLGTKPFFTKSELLAELEKAIRKDIFIPPISDY